MSALIATVDQVAGVATVTVRGELSPSACSRLRDRLVWVAQNCPQRLVLDFAGLVFLDVAGARALDGARKILATICPVIVLDPLPFARRVAGVTGPIDD